MFLKVKRLRILKVQTCAYGRKQHKNELTGDATPPTVSMGCILIKATIDAHEGKKVRICNIPGDFITSDMDKDTRMALRGR